MNGNNYYTSQRMYILLLELKGFFSSQSENIMCLLNATVLFYRSIHVQDVSQGLLKNCWKKEGV